MTLVRCSFVTLVSQNTSQRKANQKCQSSVIELFQVFVRGLGCLVAAVVTHLTLYLFLNICALLRHKILSRLSQCSVTKLKPATGVESI